MSDELTSAVFMALLRMFIAGTAIFVLICIILFADNSAGSDLHDAIVAVVESWSR